VARDVTLHMKLDRETDERLKRLALTRRTSKGQLVREAISACYQTTLTELPQRQRLALSAYQGGYISLSRLAKVMGMHALDMRKWLEDHNVTQPGAYGDRDADNA
jgi:predicted HTH domain antitoxin